MDEQFDTAKLLYEHDFRKHLKYGEIGDSDRDMEASFQISQDSNKVVFASSLSNHDTKKTDKIQIAVFDSKMNLLWSKIQDFPYQDKDFRLRQVFVQNDGIGVFAIGSIDENQQEVKLLNIQANGFQEYDLPFKEGIIPNMIVPFEKNEQGEIPLIGVYKNKNSKGISGLFSGFYNEKTNALTQMDYHLINISSNWGIPHFIASNITVLKNGNIEFLFENKRIEKPSFNGNSSQFSSSQHFFGNQILATFDPSGKILNHHIFDRKIIQNYNRISHQLFHQEGNTYLLTDSKITDSDKKKYNLKAGKLHLAAKLYCLNERGEKKYEKLLFTSKNRESYFYYHVLSSLQPNGVSFRSGKMSGSPTVRHSFKFGEIGLGD